MAQPEKLVAAAQLVDLFGEAIAEVAQVFDRIPGESPTKVRVSASLHKVSDVVKSVPAAAFRGARLLHDAADAYERSGTAQVIRDLRKRGIAVETQTPPSAYRGVR